MKVIYNSHEIGDNHNNYNRLVDKPLINSTELVGNITLNDINVYSKEEVKRLISSTRSVKVALVLPSPLTPNTTYYIGPDMNGIYTVYLTDSSDPINAFVIGTTSFGKYYSGDGINVTDPQNVVSVLVDSESVIINSEGLMEARPIFEKMVPFNPASASADGSAGIVPPAAVGDQNKVLFGDATYKDIIDLAHPVGSLFMTIPFTTGDYGPVDDNYPSTIFPGTTWVRLSADYCLRTSATGASTIGGYSVFGPKLPNVYGEMQALAYGTGNVTSGFWKWSANSGGTQYGWGNNNNYRYGDLHIDFSKASTVYKSDTGNMVRPESHRVWVWRRTA